EGGPGARSDVDLVLVDRVVKVPTEDSLDERRVDGCAHVRRRWRSVGASGADQNGQLEERSGRDGTGSVVDRNLGDDSDAMRQEERVLLHAAPGRRGRVHAVVAPAARIVGRGETVAVGGRS